MDFRGEKNKELNYNVTLRSTWVGEGNETFLLRGNKHSLAVGLNSYKWYRYHVVCQQLGP